MKYAIMLISAVATMVVAAPAPPFILDGGRGSEFGPGESVSGGGPTNDDAFLVHAQPNVPNDSGDDAFLVHAQPNVPHDSGDDAFLVHAKPNRPNNNGNIVFPDRK